MLVRGIGEKDYEVFKRLFDQEWNLFIVAFKKVRTNVSAREGQSARLEYTQTDRLKSRHSIPFARLLVNQTKAKYNMT
jgi:hypothetical protein